MTIKKTLFTSVISSLITALLIFLFSNSLGLIKVKINNSQVYEIASAFINNDNHRKALLSEMKKEGGFLGPIGPRGPEGVQGPVWIPKGALIIFDKNVSCPSPSVTASDRHAMLRIDSKQYEYTRRLAKNSSGFDGGKNWNGYRFQSCHFQ